MSKQSELSQNLTNEKCEDFCNNMRFTLGLGVCSGSICTCRVVLLGGGGMCWSLLYMYRLSILSNWVKPLWPNGQNFVLLQ
jgi:hypothetical protein